MVATTQNLALFQNFHYLMVAWEKILQLLWAHILNFVEGLTQGLDDITLTAESIYPINFTQPSKRFVLSLHYNGSNSFLFVNATKIYEFKAKDSEIKHYAMYLGNISEDFAINSMEMVGLKRIVKFFLLILILLILMILQY